MTAAMVHSSYDVLGDPSEYEAWLAAQKPPDPEPAPEADQGKSGQHVADIASLPTGIAAVVMQMDQQHAPAILSAYSDLQVLRQHHAGQDTQSALLQNNGLPAELRQHADSAVGPADASRTSRSIARWQAQQAVWARQQIAISNKMRRPVTDMAMSNSRAAEWRDKKELLTTMDAAIPLTQRGAGGADVWPLQLRNNWTRHVPLGNLFSGLFVEIKEKTNAEQAEQLVNICRPELLEPELFPASAAGGLPISAGALSPNKTRRRSWASSDYLADRLQYFSKYMKEAQPHKAEAVAVTGTPVHPTHLRQDITLDDLAASLRLEHAEVAVALLKARDCLHEQAQQQQRRAEQEAAAAEAAASAERAKPKGPLMELSGQRLLFECSAGSTACAGLALTNTGSTCLYYRWERIQPPHHRRHPANLFHLPDQAGAVLPGALHNFCFQFSPSANGMHSETWVLHTHPATPQSSCPITLRGTAVTPNMLGRERRQIAALLADREKTCKVTAALERILADVQSGPAAAPVWGTERQQQESAFNTANAAVQPPVYFSPDAFEALTGLYGKLQEAIAAAAPLPVDPKKAKSSKTPPPPAAPTFPAEWDASLNTLTAAQQHLATLDAPAADRIKKQVEEARQALLVPQHRQILHRHAVRRLLQQAADAIDTAADTVKQACTEKEQQRAAATAPAAPPPKGGKAAAAAAPAAPMYNSEEFKRDLKAPVMQALRESIDQLANQLQSEEQSIAGCLQQRIALAQADLQQKAEPSKAEPEVWDLFVLLRHEASLGLNSEPAKSRSHTTAAS